jgi:sulfate adenylyltransferase
VEEKMEEAHEMLSLSSFVDFVYDAEKIAIGAYSPLEGFMDEASFVSVISENRLPNGLPWTMPIILAPSDDNDVKTIWEMREGDDVALRTSNGDVFAFLHLAQKFAYNKEAFASRVYGTTDISHPNVADLYKNYGAVALAGKIDLIRRLGHGSMMPELTPSETREYIRGRGWRNVVAYQCRNPPHTAHEYLQRCALENADIDGLFIHPVVGRLKSGDYKPEVIMEAYEVAVQKYYRKERVLLSPLLITMRYAGPKAALFLAIVRKNYGATHYIVGRDQAGVRNFYRPYDCHRIFDDYEIGIIPLRYTETFYCKACGWMATEKTCPHPESEHLSTSQTKIRDLLKQGKDLPEQILRPEVAEILGRPDVILER